MYSFDLECIMSINDAFVRMYYYLTKSYVAKQPVAAAAACNWSVQELYSIGNIWENFVKPHLACL